MDDIEFLVCANPSFIYDKLRSHTEIQNKKMIEECIVKKNDEFITNFYKNNENNKGIFICIEKKPVGFLLYYLRDSVDVIDIQFLLIDKDKQKTNLGTEALNYLKSQYKNYQLQTLSDDTSSDIWYTRQGFVTSTEYISLIMQKYPDPTMMSEKENSEMLCYMTDYMNDKKFNRKENRLYYFDN